MLHTLIKVQIDILCNFFLFILYCMLATVFNIIVYLSGILSACRRKIPLHQVPKQCFHHRCYSHITAGNLFFSKELSVNMAVWEKATAVGGLLKAAGRPVFQKELDCDTVVLAAGMRADTSLAEQRKDMPRVISIDDRVKARRILEAVKEAREAVLSIQQNIITE